jgi:hypothetical protein
VESQLSFSIRTAAAVVDRIPTPSKPRLLGSKESSSERSQHPPIGDNGSEGMAYIAGLRGDLPLSSTIEEPKHSEPKHINIQFCVDPSISETVVKKVQIPLASTIFQSGQENTLFVRGWTHNGIASTLTEIQSAPVAQVRIDCMMGSDRLLMHRMALSAPLLPLTQPREIRAAMGNVVRRVITDASEDMPASQELEAAVNSYFIERDLPASSVAVWALITNDRERQSQKHQDWSDYLPKTWRVDPPVWGPSRSILAMLQVGARLHRVVSGGGGWGNKAGLISLDPDSDFGRSDGMTGNDEPRGDDSDASELTMDMLGTAAKPGDEIQFLISRADYEDPSVSVPTADAWTFDFGTIPSTIDAMPSLNTVGQLLPNGSTTVERYPHHFGALSEKGISLSFGGPALGDSTYDWTTTKFDIPYSRLSYRHELPVNNIPLTKPKVQTGAEGPLNKGDPSTIGSGITADKDSAIARFGYANSRFLRNTDRITQTFQGKEVFSVGKASISNRKSFSSMVSTPAPKFNTEQYLEFARAWAKERGILNVHKWGQWSFANKLPEVQHRDLEAEWARFRILHAGRSDSDYSIRETAKVTDSDISSEKSDNIHHPEEIHATTQSSDISVNRLPTTKERMDNLNATDILKGLKTFKFKSIEPSSRDIWFNAAKSTELDANMQEATKARKSAQKFIDRAMFTSWPEFVAANRNGEQAAIERFKSLREEALKKPTVRDRHKFWLSNGFPRKLRRGLFYQSQLVLSSKFDNAKDDNEASVGLLNEKERRKFEKGKERLRLKKIFPADLPHSIRHVSHENRSAYTGGDNAKSEGFHRSADGVHARQKEKKNPALGSEGNKSELKVTEHRSAKEPRLRIRKQFNSLSSVDHPKDINHTTPRLRIRRFPVDLPPPVRTVRTNGVSLRQERAADLHAVALRLRQTSLQRHTGIGKSEAEQDKKANDYCMEAAARRKLRGSVVRKYTVEPLPTNRVPHHARVSSSATGRKDVIDRPINTSKSGSQVRSLASAWIRSLPTRQPHTLFPRRILMQPKPASLLRKVQSEPRHDSEEARKSRLERHALWLANDQMTRSVTVIPKSPSSWYENPAAYAWELMERRRVREEKRRLAKLGLVRTEKAVEGLEEQKAEYLNLRKERRMLMFEAHKAEKTLALERLRNAQADISIGWVAPVDRVVDVAEGFLSGANGVNARSTVGQLGIEHHQRMLLDAPGSTTTSSMIASASSMPTRSRLTPSPSIRNDSLTETDASPPSPPSGKNAAGEDPLATLEQKLSVQREPIKQLNERMQKSMNSIEQPLSTTPKLLKPRSASIEPLPTPPPPPHNPYTEDDDALAALERNITSNKQPLKKSWGRLKRSMKTPASSHDSSFSDVKPSSAINTIPLPPTRLSTIKDGINVTRKWDDLAEEEKNIRLEVRRAKMLVKGLKPRGDVGRRDGKASLDGGGVKDLARRAGGDRAVLKLAEEVRGLLKGL